jgi:hypothetical protein
LNGDFVWRIDLRRKQMRGRWFVVAMVAAMTLVATPALAEYPTDCLGLNEASGSDCMGINDIGCCDDAGRVVWCDGGQLFCIDCAAASPQCGWKPDAGFYDCGTDDGAADPSGDNPKDCVACDPPCGDGEICVGGVCEVCTPDCSGKQCGSDGCGGTCGECAGECVAGLCHMGPGCEATEAPLCNGCACENCVCELDSYCCETAWDSLCVGQCISDCGGCPSLENCGDDQCVADDFENCATCPADCACGEGSQCFQGECCVPSCDEKTCGDDGCGGTCGDCGAGQFCNDAFACEDLPQCVVAQEIFCGDAIEGTTVGAENLLDGYSCSSWDESGGEVGFLFNTEYLPEGVTEDNVIVTIEYGEEGDLDLFALEGACTIQDCIDNGNTEVDITVNAGSSYYFVADGYGGAAGSFTIKVVCISTCEPVCTDGPCSDNGCKGLCPCETEGDLCYQGECCTPSCDGKECGDDGCGGSCGACGEGTACVEGICKEATCEGSCGGGSPFGCFCDELCFEYGDCCLDVCDFCFELEQCVDLSNCGNGECNTEVGENCSNCADDCLCEGEGEICFDGACCVPSCEGLECGSDGCGGSCGECGPGMGCADGVCIESTGPAECLGPNEPSADSCPDGMTYEGCCDDLGRALWCDQGKLFCIDCGASNPSCGWQGEFYDCGTDGSGDPSGAFPLECDLGGGCDPACGPGEKCVDGACVECVPDCKGKSCGDDGCGGSCGECGDGQCVDGGCHGGAGCEVEEGPGCNGCDCEACVCEIDAYCCDTQYDDICVGICINDCGGCPMDPVENCGNGSCDAGEDCANCAADCGCDAGFSCEGGECVEETCTPDCTDKVCGDDGCSGSCGECAAGESCTEGQCGCAPQCDGKECGDDGCGSVCGTCDGGFSCYEGLCVAEIGVDVIASDVQGDDLIPEADASTTKPEKKKSGCTTSDNGNPFALMLFLSMLLAIVAIRRVNA